MMGHSPVLDVPGVAERGGREDHDALMVGTKDSVHNRESGFITRGDQRSLDLVRGDQNTKDVLVIHLLSVRHHKQPTHLQLAEDRLADALAGKVSVGEVIPVALVPGDAGEIGGPTADGAGAEAARVSLVLRF